MALRSVANMELSLKLLLLVAGENDQAAGFLFLVKDVACEGFAEGAGTACDEYGFIREVHFNIQSSLHSFLEFSTSALMTRILNNETQTNLRPFTINNSECMY